jgi:hypothetical protein
MASCLVVTPEVETSLEIYDNKDKDGKAPLPSEGKDGGICPLPHGTPCKGVEELPTPPLGLEKIRLELAET